MELGGVTSLGTPMEAAMELGAVTSLGKRATEDDSSSENKLQCTYVGTVADALARAACEQAPTATAQSSPHPARAQLQMRQRRVATALAVGTDGHVLVHLTLAGAHSVQMPLMSEGDVVALIEDGPCWGRL